MFNLSINIYYLLLRIFINVEELKNSKYSHNFTQFDSIIYIQKYQNKEYFK